MPKQYFRGTALLNGYAGVIVPKQAKLDLIKRRAIRAEARLQSALEDKRRAERAIKKWYAKSKYYRKLSGIVPKGFKFPRVQDLN